VIKSELWSIQQISNWYGNHGNHFILRRIRAKIAQFEEELPKLREITTILELALWKMEMDQANNQENETRPWEKEKTDESSVRQHSHVTCGADAVIRHVLPYLLISAVDEYSESDAEVDDDSESSEGEYCDK
jgi:hypothetical protein